MLTEEHFPSRVSPSDSIKWRSAVVAHGYILYHTGSFTQVVRLRIGDNFSTMTNVKRFFISITIFMGCSEIVEH